MNTLDQIDELKKILAATKELLEAFEDTLRPACLRIDLHRMLGNKAHLEPHFADFGYLILDLRKELIIELAILEKHRDDPDFAWAIHQRIC